MIDRAGPFSVAMKVHVSIIILITYYIVTNALCCFIDIPLSSFGVAIAFTLKAVESRETSSTMLVWVLGMTSLLVSAMLEWFTYHRANKESEVWLLAVVHLKAFWDHQIQEYLEIGATDWKCLTKRNVTTQS